MRERPIVMIHKLVIIGVFVFYLPHSIRSAIVWAMMPAALWSGMQAPECECASGEHRFYCLKMFAAGAPAESPVRNESKHDCCAQASPIPSPTCCAAKTTGDARRVSGVQSDSSVPCGHCKAIPSSPISPTDRVEAPAADWTAWLPLGVNADQVSLIVSQGSDYRLPPSDRLPMTDRVIVLCCLLI